MSANRHFSSVQSRCSMWQFGLRAVSLHHRTMTVSRTKWAFANVALFSTSFVMSMFNGETVSCYKSFSCSVCKGNQGQHNRYFNQNADNSCKCCARIQTEQTYGHSHGQFKKVRGAD
jgi:hypothetical protein